MLDLAWLPLVKSMGEDLAFGQDLQGQRRHKFLGRLSHGHLNLGTLFN